MEKESEEKYSFEGHSPYKLRSWDVCKFCGLVGLKNPISQLCWKLGCNYKLHAQYKKWIVHIRKGGDSFII